jgi:uncharacterized protein YoxC
VSYLDLVILAKLDSLAQAVADLAQAVQTGQVKQMAAIDDLTAQVAANTSAEDSAVTLLNELAAMLAAAGTDPAKLAALQTDLKTHADALAAAIVANTPAAP